MKKQTIIICAIVAAALALWYWRKRTSKVGTAKVVDELKAIDQADMFPLAFGNTTPSEKVKDIQTRLNYLDHTNGNGTFQIAVDGLFGPETSDRLNAAGYTSAKVSISKEDYSLINS